MGCSNSIQEFNYANLINDDYTRKILSSKGPFTHPQVNDFKAVERFLKSQSLINMLIQRTNDEGFMKHTSLVRLSKSQTELEKKTETKEILSASYQEILIKAYLLSNVLTSLADKIIIKKEVNDNKAKIKQVRVGIFISNSIEHLISDIAIQMSELVSVNYHITMNKKQILQATNLTQPEIVIVGLKNTVDDLVDKIDCIVRKEENSVKGVVYIGSCVNHINHFSHSNNNNNNLNVSQNQSNDVNSNINSLNFNANTIIEKLLLKKSVEIIDYDEKVNKECSKVLKLLQGKSALLYFPKEFLSKFSYIDEEAQINSNINKSNYKNESNVNNNNQKNNDSINKLNDEYSTPNFHANNNDNDILNYNNNSKKLYGVFFDVNEKEELKHSFISQCTMASNLHSFHNTCYASNSKDRIFPISLFSLLETRILLYSYLHCGSTICINNYNIYYSLNSVINIYSSLFQSINLHLLSDDELEKTIPQVIDLKNKVKKLTSCNKSENTSNTSNNTISTNSPETLFYFYLKEIKSLSPTSIVLTPKILLNLERKSLEAYRQLKGLSLKLFKDALTSKRDCYLKDKSITDSFYDAFVFNKIRGVMGNKVENFIVINNFKHCNSTYNDSLTNMKMMFGVPIIEAFSTIDTGFVTFTGFKDTSNLYLGYCGYGNSYLITNTTKYSDIKIEGIRENGYCGELLVRSFNTKEYYEDVLSKERENSNGDNDHDDDNHDNNDSDCISSIWLKTNFLVFLNISNHGFNVMCKTKEEYDNSNKIINDFQILRETRTNTRILEDIYIRSEYTDEVCLIPKEFSAASSHYYLIVKPNEEQLRRLCILLEKEVDFVSEGSKGYFSDDILNDTEILESFNIKFKEIELNANRRNISKSIILIREFDSSCYDFYGNYNKKRIRELYLSTLLFD